VRRLLHYWRPLLAVALVFGAAITVWAAIPRLGFFRIGTVEVVGLEYLDEAAVVRQLGIPTEADILTPLAPIAANAALVPGLRSATVSRRWPGTLRVTVEEAPPVAVIIDEGRVAVIDDRAELLPYPPGRVAASLPLATRDSATAALLGRLRRADPLWYATFDEAVVEGEEVRLVADRRVIMLRSDADETLLRRLAAVRGWLDDQAIAWRDLDLRFRGRVFVRREAA
jgi:hypothetical protein